jgi:hypothetical protein
MPLQWSKRSGNLTTQEIEMRKKQPQAPAIRTAVFRPDSRDARKDFLIPLDVARDLYERGEIYGDATNGGYCPNPASNYNVRQHRIVK